jgi:hypothetical protein
MKTLWLVVPAILAFGAGAGCATTPRYPDPPELKIDSAHPSFAVALKPDAPKEVRQYWESCVRQKSFQISQAQEELRRHLVDMNGMQLYKATGESGENKLKLLEESVRRYADPKRFPESDMSSTLHGAGVVKGKIVQIVDEDNMLVDADFSDQFDADKKLVWVTGYSTKEYVDGSRFYGTLIEDGRKQYEGLGGQRTITLLRYFDFEKWLTKP